MLPEPVIGVGLVGRVDRLDGRARAAAAAAPSAQLPLLVQRLRPIEETLPSIVLVLGAQDLDQAVLEPTSAGSGGSRPGAR